VENISTENEVLVGSNGPYEVIPVVRAFESICVRFVRADWKVLLDGRLFGAGKSGPINGQFVNAYVERGSKTPRTECLESIVTCILKSAVRSKMGNMLGADEDNKLAVIEGKYE